MTHDRRADVTAKELAELTTVLRNGKQADEDGVMVIISRQAVVMAADELDRLAGEVERLRGLLRHAVDICGGCGCAACDEARAALEGSPSKTTTGGNDGPVLGD